MTGTRRFHAHRRETCRICGGDDLARYLDLGAQPPSNAFVSTDDVAGEESFPLEVYLCRHCGLSQLGHVVAAGDIFDDYGYLSSTSEALCRHYRDLIDKALATFAPAEDALMVDIGCNDGIMLKSYPAGRYRLLGIEPSSAGAFARAAGFEVIDAFFDADLGNRLSASHGPAALITATNVFAHVDDIAGFAAGARALLADDGVFILEFPYLGDMLEQGYFDTVYHEHLSYLGLTPVVRLFGDVGLRAIAVERHPIGASGPALRVFARRDDSTVPAAAESVTAMLAEEADWGITALPAYEAFADRVDELKGRIAALVRSLNDGGHRIGAFGAPAKGNTLLNSVGLNGDDIIAAAENNDLKIGKLTPGSHIPVVDDDTFLQADISHALLLAWNYTDYFLANAAFIKSGGKFIIPLPEPHIRP